VNGTAKKLMIPYTGHSPHKEAESIVINATIEFVETLKQELLLY